MNAKDLIVMFLQDVQNSYLKNIRLAETSSHQTTWSNSWSARSKLKGAQVQIQTTYINFLCLDKYT